MAEFSFLTDGASLTLVLSGAAALIGAFARVVEGMPEGYKPPVEQIDWEGFKARIRAENGVRLITEEESGEPLSKVANGIYGHSFSPSFDNPIPIFYRTSFQCFELHKLLNGESVILGCVTKDVAEKLKAGEFVSFRLYPEPYDTAVAPIVLNYKHIIRSNNKVSRHNGNYIEFDAKIGD
jgi:hypothetical protein